MRNNAGTICALSTPIGAGIAVLRVSGPDAKAVLRAVFRPGGNEIPAKTSDKTSAKTATVTATITTTVTTPVIATEIKPRRLTYGHAVSPDGELIDEVMAVYMPAPRTYTREPMAEVHCHGGGATVRRVLGSLMAAGARFAEPGEFTKRAFLNGRLDLAQAEAVMGLISASTDAQSRRALSQLGGALSENIARYEDKLTSMLAAIEAAIDFPDEVEEEQTAQEVHVDLIRLSESLEKACGAKVGRILREGINAVIVGKPNVGKSSLTNALLRRDVAIVTDIPGTTRDVLTTPLTLGGMLVQLTDTAGLRETDGPVERIGVMRAKEALRTADVLLFVIDASEEINAEDKDIMKQVLEAGVPFLVILSKGDLPRVTDREAVTRLWPPSNNDSIDSNIIEVSAISGEGLEKLDAAVAEYVGVFGNLEGTFIYERHIEAATRAASALRSAAEATLHSPLDCAAIDIRDALHALGEITGKTVDDAVIDRIFADFCVGK